jgi:hypothetical protein
MDRCQERAGSKRRLAAAPLRAKLGAGLAATIALLAAAAGPAAAMTGRDHLAQDLALNIGTGLKTSDIPEADRDRTADCLAKAIANDIPDSDASRLSDIFEQRAQPDEQLQGHWLTITKQDGRLRYQEVMAQVHTKCPDLGPYVEQMLAK